MSYDANRRSNLAHGFKSARKKTGLSASQAAEKIAAMGVTCSRGTLLAWERGSGATSREPFASDLAVIAAIYGCRVIDFFTQPGDESANGRRAMESVAV